MVFLRLSILEIDFRKIVCWIFRISIRTRNYFQWSIEQQSMWPSTCNREFETESKKQIVVKDFRLRIVNATTSVEFQFQCIPILIDDILECTKVSLPSEFMTKVLQLLFIHYSWWRNTLILYLKHVSWLPHWQAHRWNCSSSRRNTRKLSCIQSNDTEWVEMPISNSRWNFYQTMAFYFCHLKYFLRAKVCAIKRCIA